MMEDKDVTDTQLSQLVQDMEPMHVVIGGSPMPGLDCRREPIDCDLEPISVI